MHIRVVNPSTTQSRTLVTANDGVSLTDLHVSPNGHLLAYVRAGGGRSEVIVRDIGSGSETVRWTKAHDWRERIFAKGWTRSGDLVVVHSTLDAQFNERVEAIRIDAPEQVGPAWERALAAGQPALIDAITDPEVPPLPPHIRPEHAKGFARALLRGDPESGRLIRQSIKGKLAEVLKR